MGSECHSENIDIKSIRMRLKVSQHEFAEALGLSQETIKSWEQGRRNPTGLAKKALKLMEKDLELYYRFKFNWTNDRWHLIPSCKVLLVISFATYKGQILKHDEYELDLYFENIEEINKSIDGIDFVLSDDFLNFRHLNVVILFIIIFVIYLLFF